MNDYILNWRTTLAGIIAATANIVVDYLNGTMDMKTFLISFAIAALGYLSKDASKTGTNTAPRL